MLACFTDTLQTPLAFLAPRFVGSLRCAFTVFKYNSFALRKAAPSVASKQNHLLELINMTHFPAVQTLSQTYRKCFRRITSLQVAGRSQCISIHFLRAPRLRLVLPTNILISPNVDGEPKYPSALQNVGGFLVLARCVRKLTAIKFIC